MSFNSGFKNFPPPPKYSDQTNSKISDRFHGLWKFSMDPEDSIEYLRAIKKYNCCIGCMIRHRPPDSNPKYVKISPGSSKTWIKTFCDANGVSLGTDFSKELTLGVEQVMDTLFGTCKILVTEGVGGGVKTRYEVLGANSRARAAVPPAVKNRPEKNRPKNRQPPNLKSKPPILTASFSVVLHRVPPVQKIVQ